VVHALLPCPFRIRGVRESVLYFEHFGIWPSVKDWLRVLGTRISRQQAAFSSHNVPRQVAMIWSEITASWDQYRVANIFGTGTYVVPAFILLSTVGLAFVRVRRFEISAFLAGIVYFVATATYGSPDIAGTVDGRFYMPIFFLLVALAVLPAEWAIRGSFKSRYSLLGVAVLALFVLSCVGYPSQSGFKPKTGRSQAWDALKYGSERGKSPRYDAQKNFCSHL